MNTRRGGLLVMHRTSNRNVMGSNFNRTFWKQFWAEMFNLTTLAGPTGLDAFYMYMAMKLTFIYNCIN